MAAGMGSARPARTGARQYDHPTHGGRARVRAITVQGAAVARGGTDGRARASERRSRGAVPVSTGLPVAGPWGHDGRRRCGRRGGRRAIGGGAARRRGVSPGTPTAVSDRSRCGSDAGGGQGGGGVEADAGARRRRHRTGRGRRARAGAGARSTHPHQAPRRAQPGVATHRRGSVADAGRSAAAAGAGAGAHRATRRVVRARGPGRVRLQLVQTRWRPGLRHCGDRIGLSPDSAHRSQAAKTAIGVHCPGAGGVFAQPVRGRAAADTATQRAATDGAPNPPQARRVAQSGYTGWAGGDPQPRGGACLAGQTARSDRHRRGAVRRGGTAAQRVPERPIWWQGASVPPR
eukprot:ctg_1432.g332